MTPADRFWAKVDKSGECWLWTAATARGHGVIRVDYTLRYAHRVAYEMTHGPIPAGLMIDHTCHVKACVNPAHLRLATAKQNAENLAGAHRDSVSGIRGVTWDRRCGRWRVEVCHAGRRFYGGHHADVEDAERAAISLRNKLFTHNDSDRAYK